VKGASKVALPIAAVSDAYSIATADNKVKEASRVAGGWTGAWAVGEAGAMGGAAVGTAIFPGVGTAVGGFIGGVVGGVAGYLGGSLVGEAAYDAVNPDPYKIETHHYPGGGYGVGGSW
jgi:phage tail tape-measure protein